MKTRALAVIGAAAGLVAVAFAVHFELNARARVDSELRGLRAETTADLADHRISPTRAAALESRLGQARQKIEQDDVRGAQRLMDRVKADLRSAASPA